MLFNAFNDTYLKIRTMKRIITILASILSFVCLVSCGGNKGVTPSKDTISGPLGQYFKVVNRTYKINDGKINIELERINEGLPDPWEEGIEVGYSDNHVEPGFVVEFMDADGDIVCKDQTDIVFEKDELVSVVALAVGETSSIPFSVNGKKVALFKVSSTFKYHEPDVTTYSSLSSSSSSSIGSSIIDEATSVYGDALKDAQKEVKDAYDEAAAEVKEAYDEAAAEMKEAMKSAIKDLL